MMMLQKGIEQKIRIFMNNADINQLMYKINIFILNFNSKYT